MATKRNDPKKRPVPAIERKPEKAADAPAARAPRPARPARAEARGAPDGPGARPDRGTKPAGKTGKPGGKSTSKPGKAGGGKAPRADMPPPPKRIGGAKNEHGTRVARRVTCTRCGRVDHVPHVPKDKDRALCSACAQAVLATFEVGVKAKAPTRDVHCNLCGKLFGLPLMAEDDGDPLCLDCLRGFTTWQGSLDVPLDQRAQGVIEERLSGTRLRRAGPR